MSDTMSFPEMIQEFIANYAFKDRKEEYTNGSMLIPVFRVDQAIDHYFSKLESESAEKDKRIAELEAEREGMVKCICSACDVAYLLRGMEPECAECKWRGIREGEK